jgi:hypothetical protein
MKLDASTVFHIRSKDCEMYNGNNAHIVCKLPYAIEIPRGKHLHCQIVSAEIPYSWYNISSTLGTDTVLVNSVSVAIPQGIYDIITLIAALNTAISGLTFAFSRLTNRISIACGASNVTVDWSNSNLCKMLGALGTAETYTAGSTTELPNCINMHPVHAIYVRSTLNSGNVISTDSSNSDIIQKVPIYTNSLGIINLNLETYLTSIRILSGNIRVFDLKLTDQNGTVLDLNRISWEMTFSFELMKNEDMVFIEKSNTTAEPGTVNRTEAVNKAETVEPTQELQNNHLGIEDHTEAEETVDNILMRNLIDQLRENA